MNGALRTWLKFNAVGAIGIPVQLSMLALLKTGLGIHYLIATGVAVETATLHNFFWHERWTWSDRTKASPAGVFSRLLRFHLSNGFISIGGNLLVMWILVSHLRIGYFVANLVAMSACAILNFWASDRLVFQNDDLNDT